MKSTKKDIVIINLEIERSKLNREKSILVLDKALMLYFSFLIIGVVGFVNGYIKPDLLNTLIIMSFAVLVIGIAPYFITMRKEEKKLNELISDYEKNRGVNNGK